MIAFIFALLLASLAALLMVARKTYALVPLPELRRQSQAGDGLAQTLYKVAGYGPAAQMLLWILVLLGVTSSIVIMAQVLPDFLQFGYAFVLIAYVLVWLPLSDVTSAGLRAVTLVTPIIVWLTSHMFVVLEKPANAAQARQTAPLHTGLYEKEDLVGLLERQKQQEDNRFTEIEVAQLLHSLTFARKKVSEIMTPRKKVKSVSRDDAIGPILMDELHESGLSFFPVYDPENATKIIGTLHLADVVRAKKGGHVRDIMRAEVFYVNDNFSVEQLLHAFMQTKQHVLIVVDNFADFVGIISVEVALRAVLGRDIVSEFSQYDDIQAVANYKPHKTTSQHVKPGVEIKAETPKAHHSEHPAKHDA